MSTSRLFTKIKLRGLLDRQFGIDVRSLALARLCLALVLLLDLAVRATNLFDHYGDGGVLPATAALGFWGTDFVWSLHLVGGGPPYLLVSLFVIHALAALALLVGYRTRFATIVAWFLLVSLHYANPLILYGGDTLLRTALFVGMFLPWGAVFSVDQALRHRKPASMRVLSGWTAAFLLQLGFLYFFTAELKSGSEWLQGTAVYYTLHLDLFTTPLGSWLLNFPYLLPLLTYGVLVLEYLAFVLLFSPIFTIPLRTIGLILLVGLHLSFAATMYIGFFSWVSIAALMAFVPSAAWDTLSRLSQTRFGRVVIYYDGECNFCRTSGWLVYTFLALPASDVRKAQEDPRVLEEMRARDSWVLKDAAGALHVEFDAFIVMLRASPLFFCFAPFLRLPLAFRIGSWAYRFIASRRPHVCVPEVPLPAPHFSPTGVAAATILGFSYAVYIFLWQAPSSYVLRPFVPKLPDGSFIPARVLGIDPYWDMFSQSPLSTDGWLVLRGTLSGGNVVDLARGGAPVSYEKPDVASLYPTMLSRKYFQNLWGSDKATYRSYYATYACKSWNRVHSREMALEELEMIFMFEKTPAPGSLPESVEPILLGSWTCER